MVSRTSNLPHGDLVELDDVRAWIDSQAGRRSPEALKKIRLACQLAFDIHSESGRREISGESTLRHALSVAEILSHLGLDADTLVAAILHDALTDDQVDLAFLTKRFGEGVATMVADMARIGDLARTRAANDRQSEAEHDENLRRMLLSIADDIRVVIVVLAERLHEMRVLKNHPEEIRQREAQETRRVYAPLANRLGIWQVKWELEDLCLRYLEPDNYARIARQLDGRRDDREKFIAEVIDRLRSEFKAAGIKADITGRPKHIYSIWKKMKRKGVDIDQIFDLRAVRVLTGSVADCYAALGVVHGLWRHIPGEFDDYIATPKANMYRSIHTAVIGPHEKTLEVQIRTREMHEHAELGVAAHWRYKESGRSDVDFDRRVVLMRNWLGAKDGEGDEAAGDFKTGFESRQVYVLTPQGKVVELPRGSTPIDFAYAVHTEIGHRCRGARVDGRIAPLTCQLKSGQLVEVITTKSGGPSRDWLNPHAGYLKTNKAKNRIRHWFKQQDYDEHVSVGRASLEREIHRLGVGKPDLERAAKRLNFQKPADLLAAIGRAEVSPVQVAGWSDQAPGPEKSGEPRPRKVRPKRHHPLSGGTGEVIVEGVGDLMTHMGRCCKPVPYDRIVGFITRGRGVTVHRRDCSVVRGLREEDRPRLVRVIWADHEADVSYPVDLRVIAMDRKGLLRDISSIFTNEDIDVVGVHTQSHRKTDRATMKFTIEITDVGQLSRIIDKVAQLPDVEDVRRQV